MNFCGQCGAAREPGTRFCVNCGSPFVGAEASPVTQPSPQGASPQQQWERLQASWWLSGSFNVESGNGAVKTQYFPYCECHLDPQMVGEWLCSECARSSMTSITFPTGHGDGVYPVFTLVDFDGQPSGAIAFFTEKWALGIEDNSLAPGQIPSEASPIWIGTIHGQGQLLFSEAGTGIDDSDVTVDVKLAEVPHEVFAWIGEVPTLVSSGITPSRRPVALGVYRSDLATALGELVSVERAPIAWESFRPWNTMMWQVMSHLAPQWSRAAMYNYSDDLKRGAQDRALSWLLQAAVHGDEQARAQLGTLWSSTDPETAAYRRELLAWRGQFT